MTTWRHGDLDAIERDLGLGGDPSDAVGESETVARHRPAFTRDWTKQLGADLSDQPPREPWPEPEVAARTAEPGEVPKTATKLAESARAGGWRVSVVYTRSAPGVDVVSVRCQLSDDASVGIWRDGRFSDAIVGVPWWPRPANAGELSAYLAYRPRGWFRWERLQLLGPAKPKKDRRGQPSDDAVE